MTGKRGYGEISILEEIKLRLISFAAWGLVSLIGRTSRMQVIGFENVQALIDSGQGFIMALWHGRTLLPIYYCRNMGILAITSLSRDGELQTRIVRRFGCRIIRGSSRLGGMKAALTACRELEAGGILSITPDGPLGPVHKVQDGIVFLAQRSNCRIVPIGVGLKSRRLIGTWDSYAIPNPFSRSAIVFGTPISLAGISDSREAAEVVEAAINDIQRAAENLAGEGN